MWGHIGKAWKSMVKEFYQILPRTRIDLLHLNIWWLEGLQLINNGFTYEQGRLLYCKGIQRVEDIWDDNQQDFLTWEQIQRKFDLTSTNEWDWVEVVDKLSGQWRYILETKKYPAYLEQWVGFYKEEETDPAFVLRCTTDYTLVCSLRYNIFADVWRIEFCNHTSLISHHSIWM